MQTHATVYKHVGETPLSAMEKWREENNIPADTPLTYAGRLDPMAEGKLLVLVGDECKKKDAYLALDKQYTFEVLFGVGSDTQDVLGHLTPSEPLLFDQRVIEQTLKKLEGPIELAYPHFSSKTVQGKPLHTWTLEGRLGEIEIPTKASEIFSIKLTAIKAVPRSEVYTYASNKIETIPPVTEERKALGNDFRRDMVRENWNTFKNEGDEGDLFYIATITCIASSGTYMRSLANLIGAHLDTQALAYSINRTHIGHYKKIPLLGGIWTKRY